MINIGTNFSYHGILFLDERQGIAESKNALKEWDFLEIPIPDGFEVYLNIDGDPAWYTYKPAPEGTFDAETGWFERRLDKSYVDSQISIINDKINTIWHGYENNDSENGLGGIQAIWDYLHNLQPIELPIKYDFSATWTPAGGNKVPGTNFAPNVTWSLKKRYTWENTGGTEVSFDDIEYAQIQIDNNTPININSHSWTGSSVSGAHGDSHTYKLIVKHSGTPTAYNKSVTYNWKNYDWHKWFGLSPNPTISAITDLYSRDHKYGWNSFPFEYTTTANCSEGGGAYPYYVVPKDSYPGDSHVKITVGVTEMNDFVTNTIIHEGKEYKYIRFTYLQHGEAIYIKYETK